MNLSDILITKFKDADFLKDIKIQDDGDGQLYIKEWNYQGAAKPTQADLDAWATDPVIVDTYNLQQNAIRNKPIIDKLDKIDLKSIRAVRTNDTVRLAELEAQAVELRSQLILGDK